MLWTSIKYYVNLIDRFTLVYTYIYILFYTGSSMTGAFSHLTRSICILRVLLVNTTLSPRASQLLLPLHLVLDRCLRMGVACSPGIVSYLVLDTQSSKPMVLGNSCVQSTGRSPGHWSKIPSLLRVVA